MMKKTKAVIILLLIVSVSLAFSSLPDKCGTIPALEEFKQGVKLPRPSSGPNYVNTAHFRIHYNVTNTTTAYAESVAKYAEYSWAKQVDTLKFASPPPDGTSGGDNRYDMYVRSLAYLGVTTGEAFYTTPYPDGMTSYIQIDNGIASSYGWGVLRVTVAHEFNHACQYRYSYLEDNFWYENTATWMEDMCYDNVNDYVSYLSSNPNPLGNPYLPIDDTTNLYWYAGATWAMFLQEFYNDSCPRFCWERMGSISGDNTLSGIDYILTNKYSSNLMVALKKYAVYRYFTGSRADAYHFSEASTWPTSFVMQTHTTYPASGTELTYDPSGPGGTNYIKFTSGTNTLRAIFDGQDGNNWSAYLIGYRNPSQSTETEFSLNSGYCDTLDLAWSGNSAIVLIPVVTQWASVADNKTFTYSASQVSLSNKDVGVTAIEAPTGPIDSTGATVIPRARVRNYKSDSTTFNVTFKIGTWSSSRTKKLNGLTEDTVNFTVWTPVRGTYATRCSIYLLNDTNKVNDTLRGSVTVNVTDVGVAKIIAPVGTFDSLTSVTPACSVYNYGTTIQSYLVRMKVGSFYNDTFRMISQAGGGKNYVTFTPLANWPRGIQTVTCSTELAIDENPANNKKSGSVIVTVVIPAPWTLMQSVPLGNALKKVRGGGSLVTGIAGMMYAFKGNNKREFYAYDIGDDTWESRESIPDNPEFRKRVNKGARLAYNKHSNPDIIYATKGNNTLELWAYDVENDSWFSKPNVPANPARIKKVKGGASLVFIKRGSQHYLYLLKGNNTREFYGYHCQADTWITSLDSAPLGPDSKRYRDGSCMTVVDDMIYLLKGGAKYNEFYAYDVPEDTWYTLESIPKYNDITTKKTKVKDGGTICYDGDSLLYAFKGGNQEFWVYNINQHTWSERDTIPKGVNKKKVGSGGSLAFADNKVYALKGNNCLEYWCYDPEAISNIKYQKSNINTQTTTNDQSLISSSQSHIEVTPNPFSEQTTIRYNVPISGRISIKLYNSSGSLIETLVNDYKNIGSYSLRIDNRKLKIPAGLYILKHDIGNESGSVKIIVK